MWWNSLTLPSSTADWALIDHITSKQSSFVSSDNKVDSAPNSIICIELSILPLHVTRAQVTQCWMM